MKHYPWFWFGLILIIFNLPKPIIAGLEYGFQSARFLFYALFLLVGIILWVLVITSQDREVG